MKTLRLVVTLLTSMTLTACAAERKVMTQSHSSNPDTVIANSPKLQKLFERTKALCVGRLIIQVPEEATVVWGATEFLGKIEIFENGAKDILKTALQKRDQLKNIPHKKLPGSLLIEEFFEPEKRVTLFFWEDPVVTFQQKVWSFIKANPHGFVLKSSASKIDGPEFTPQAIKTEAEFFSKNLRSRTPTEVPTDPGVCIEGGFIADASGKYQEIFAVGIRLPSLPDVSFSLYSNKDQQRDPPLSTRRKKAEQNAEAAGKGDEFRKIKVLREGKRQLAIWQTEEALFLRPRADGSGAHEFRLESQGVRYDKDQPFMDIMLHTGVKANRPNASPSSLTDEEAIALWDKLLGTLRLRVAP